MTGRVRFARTRNACAVPRVSTSADVMTKSSLKVQVAPVKRGMLNRTTGSVSRLASQRAITAAISNRAANSSGRGLPIGAAIHPGIEETEDEQDHGDRCDGSVQRIEQTTVGTVGIEQR